MMHNHFQIKKTKQQKKKNRPIYSYRINLQQAGTEKGSRIFIFHIFCLLNSDLGDR